jgi:DNA-binding MarR family transcriptional regulator
MPSDAGAIVGELQTLFARGRHLQAHGSWFRSVSTTHLHVLMMLHAEGDLSMSRLADALDVSLSSATGIVTRMEERGLVERVRDASDRRVVHVRSTERGSEVTDELELVQGRHLSRLVDAMTPAERATCLEALRVVTATMGRLGIEYDHETGAPCPALKTMKEKAPR